MKRKIDDLSRSRFDLLIIGGGIYGATAAWEAASRGLKVALIDQSDFGSKTSANSLKIIHGGLRYLQQLDIKRVRESVHERRILMGIAPHLVHPLSCIMPTRGYFMKSKWVMRIGLLMNDILTIDRNRLKDPEKTIPAGKVVSKGSCHLLCPGVDDRKVTGGALWTDAQMYNSERVTLAFILSAVKEGAKVANYVKATGFLKIKERIIGIKAHDQISGELFEIRASLVLNACGGWIDQVLKLLGNSKPERFRLSTAMNLIINRPVLPECAAGLTSRFVHRRSNGKQYKGSRILFMTPWRDYTIVGTKHQSYDDQPDRLSITEEEIDSFLNEVNGAYPGVLIKRDEVSFFHKGFLPMDGIHHKTGEVNLTKHYQIIDHHVDDGLEGLISVIGVKYTTARDVSERVVNLIMNKLNKPHRRSISSQKPLEGGEIPKFYDYLSHALDEYSNRFIPSVIQHLIYSYGSNHSQIIKIIKKDKHLGTLLPQSKEVLRAEVIHAVREEMVVKLADLIFRRTDIGSAGEPGSDCLKECGSLMAKELGWNQKRKEEEIREVKKTYRPIR